MEIEVTIFQDLEFWINDNFIMAMEKFGIIVWKNNKNILKWM